MAHAQGGKQAESAKAANFFRTLRRRCIQCGHLHYATICHICKRPA